MSQDRNDRLLTSIDDVIALFIRASNMKGFPVLPHVDADFVRRQLKLWPKLDSVAISVGDALMTVEQPVSSYFGGRPALPDQLEWPKATNHANGGERSMLFLGQICCDEFANLQKPAGLPTQGYLYLFVAWDAEWGLLDPSCKVIYSKLDPARQERPIPADILTPRKVMHDHGQWGFKFQQQPGDDDIRSYPRRRIKFASFSSLFREQVKMGDSRDELERTFLWQWTEFARDFEIAQMLPALGIDSWPIFAFGIGDNCRVLHQLMGFPRASETDQSGLIREYEKISRRFVEKPGDRVLLAEFECDKLMDWDWNGILELRIHPTALAAQNFEDVTADYRTT
jgi:uncharacterized protein YwqG